MQMNPSTGPPYETKLFLEDTRKKILNISSFIFYFAPEEGKKKGKNENFHVGKRFDGNLSAPTDVASKTQTLAGPWDVWLATKHENEARANLD